MLSRNRLFSLLNKENKNETNITCNRVDLISKGDSCPYTRRIFEREGEEYVGKYNR